MPTMPGWTSAWSRFFARKVWRSKRFNDFTPKSAKTFEVSHFFMLLARKVWQSKHSQWFSSEISNNIWSVTCFMLLARKVWHSNRFQWFPPRINQNAWSVTRFHVFSKKSVTLQVILDPGSVIQESHYSWKFIFWDFWRFVLRAGVPEFLKGHMFWVFRRFVLRAVVP